MIRDLGTPPSTPASEARLQARPAPPATDAAPAPAAKVAPVLDLADTAKAAAQWMLPGRHLDVSTFYDEETGRTVVRVADRDSGEVIMQVPAEELLRFYAAAAADRRPLLTIQA